MQTERLQLPYIAPSQAQKHVTHNEALRGLDALVQTSAVSRSINTPPAEPQSGESHIVGPAPTGPWEGKAGMLASFQDGAWAFHAPQVGWRCWVADENALFAYAGTGWTPIHALGGNGRFDTLGINAAADATDRLAVASEATLFDHSGGDHRMKINKSAPPDTASLIFQTGYSGRAEFGLAGDDDFSVKVSADGAMWRTALTIAASDGKIAFPQGLASALPVASGGTGAVNGLEALGSLGLRFPVGNIANDTVATVDFGGAVYGSVIFLVGNTIAVPLGTVFARMAPSPDLVPLGLAGGALGAFTTALTGTTGPDGQVNMAALEGGVFQIENRVGYEIGYTLYLLR